MKLVKKTTVQNEEYYLKMQYAENVYCYNIKLVTLLFSYK